MVIETTSLNAGVGEQGPCTPSSVLCLIFPWHLVGGISERDRILLLASRNAGAAVVGPFGKESKGTGNGLE